MSGLNEEKPVSRVRCTQDEFYVVADTIIGNFEQRKSVFILNSGKYTNTTGADLLAELEAAQALPDEVERVSRHSEKRTELVALNKTGLRKMNLLRGFIRDGFDAAVFEDKLDQAGFSRYEEAYQEDWAAMKQMLTKANTFITNNAVLLGTPGGMPVNFAAEFAAHKTATLNKYQAFLQEEEEAKNGTVAKIEANNALYDKLMPLCDDGQKFFWDEPGIRDEFVYEVVLNLVRDSTAKHRVGGTVLKEEDSLPLVQAEVLLEKLNEVDGSLTTVEVVKTNVEGKFNFQPVKKGKYRVTASYPGRVTQRKDIEVKDGPVVVDFSLVLE